MVVIFKELREVKADLKLQQIENGRKQDRILELLKENRELKEQIKELMEVLNDRKHTTTKQTSSRKTSK